MEERKLKLLYVSHDANRAGAPILSLHILRWLQANKDVTLGIMLLKGGSLEGEFAKIAPTMIVESKPRGRIGTFTRKATRTFFSGISQWRTASKIKSHIRAFAPDIIYANTAVSLSVIGALPALKNYKTICHLHELDFVIQTMVGEAAFRKSLAQADAMICVAGALREYMIRKYNYPLERTVIIPEPFTVSAKVAGQGDVRKHLGIPEDAFIVMGAGTTDWRKAPELFLLTAAQVKDVRRDVYFVWIGQVDTRKLFMLNYDIERLKLAGKVMFVGQKENPMEYFAQADVFYLTSREDPYPLVCLEAASLGKPVICFEGAGGMPGFVRDDAGQVVPYLDVVAAARGIEKLVGDPALRVKLGETARVRATTESTIERVGPQIWEVIESVKNKN
jgi:glycosyltransferase involved in cell wall biosynthesis